MSQFNLVSAELLSCGCSNVPESCGNCRFTKFVTEDGELIEMRYRMERRQKWEANRKLSFERAHLAPGQYHYVDEYFETLMPCDFDQHYKCDNCKLNHIEEDCPRYINHNPIIPVVKGKQRLGHTDTKKESIDAMKMAVIKRNDALKLEDEQLQNGFKFCNCCGYSISPANFHETVTSHPGRVKDIGEPHESYRYAVYGFTCCRQGADESPGCCNHNHVFDA